MRCLSKFFLAILLLTAASGSSATCIKWDYKGNCVETLSTHLSTSDSLTNSPNRFNLVGAFENGNEYFLGNVLVNLLSGTGRIDVRGEKSRIRCRGFAKVNYTPWTTLVQRASGLMVCAGQEGSAVLRCDGGQVLRAIYDVNSCDSGTGHGADSNGQGFYFQFGPDYQVAREWVAQEAKLQLESNPELATDLQSDDRQLAVDKEVESEFWRSIKDSNDRDMFRAYLDVYPNGKFSALAQTKLQKLN